MSKLVSENISDYLPGPSEEEIEKRLEDANLDSNELLVKSAEKGYLKGVKKALDQGADIHFKQDDAICHASLNGHLDIVKYLYENGAYIEASGGLPLVWSAAAGQLDVVKYLVQKGASINKYSVVNPIKAAIDNGHLDVLKYLGEFIKEIYDIKSIRTVIEDAIKNGYLNILKYIESKWSYLSNIREPSYFKDALDLAHSNNHMETISYFKDKVKEENE